ncbi:Transcription factor SFL2 [Meyerozyma sp. JA9]|nr:Transcription factor SFL2 [Meyerozyma sp. JA9]
MSKRADPPVKKNAFVHKLYSMLNDESLSQLIWWTGGEHSNTFALFPGKEFASVLTRYFKHGNVASFVRQLHMYGFHKVSDPHAHKQDDDDSQPPIWEFKHSSGKFRKNDESSLLYIKRRSSSNSSRSNFSDHESNYLIPTSTPSPTYDGYHQFPHPPPSSHPHQYMQQPPQSQLTQHPQQLSQHQSLQHPQQPHPSPVGYPYYVLPTVGSQVPGSFHSIQQPPAQADQIYGQREGTPQPEEAEERAKYVQPYAPNLQFRRIWDPQDDEPRRRKSSLLYDPLAPSGSSGTFVKHPQHIVDQQHQQHQTMHGYPHQVQRPVTPSGALVPVMGTQSRSLPGSLSGPMASHPRSHPNSQSTPGRIKLPPPSSLASFSSSRNSSPGPGDLVSRSVPSSLSNESSNKSSPITLLDRLRPSLVELHANPLLTSQKNSIDSQSSYNSIFSASSSISSDSSFPRNSSFGSISYAGVESTKASISIGPHDIPEDHNAERTRSKPMVGSIEVSPDAMDETPEVPPTTTRPNLVRSLTPPATFPNKVHKRPAIQSPHPRTSSLQATHSHGYQKVRSHTSSPLSRYSYGQIDVKDQRSRVSITSLLVDKPPPSSRLSDINSIINESEENSSTGSVSSEEQNYRRQRVDQ